MDFLQNFYKYPTNFCKRVTIIICENFELDPCFHRALLVKHPVMEHRWARGLHGGVPQDVFSQRLTSP